MQVIGVKIEEPREAQEIFDDIESYREKHDIFLQILEPEKVIGVEHLLWAFQKAEESFENGSNRADSLEIETLLWASAEWQIKDALDKMGIEDNAEQAAVMIDDESEIENLLDSMNWTRDDEVLEPTEEKLKRFGIDEKEIRSVDDPYDLVFEKMATSVL